MNIGLFTRRSLALCVAIAGLALAPAGAAAATASTTSPTCAALPVTQPFLAWSDANWYSLLPGQTTSNFAGDGWVLSGGAQIVTTMRANGSTATVLDLPSGAKAVSPAICVTSSYPTARTMVRDLVGSEGVFVYVSYAGASNQNVGQVHGVGTAWTLATPVNIHSAPISGWQPVQFTLVGGGNTSRFQVYNFYVDPRMF